MFQTGRKSKLFEGMICLYWSLFWMLNGIDKFLNGRDLAFFRWEGKDRTYQFSYYFSNIDLPKTWIGPTLNAIGLWEIAVSFLFLGAVLFCCTRNHDERFRDFAEVGFWFSTMTFIVFSIFDVIAGSRIELFEHGVYIGMNFLSWFVITRTDDRLVR